MIKKRVKQTMKKVDTVEEATQFVNVGTKLVKFLVLVVLLLIEARVRKSKGIFVGIIL